MAGLYSQKLVEQGFATFAFDFRYWGESGGEPHQYESGAAKTQDFKNAMTFLQSLPMIDPNHIGGLGICASAWPDGLCPTHLVEIDLFRGGKPMRILSETQQTDYRTFHFKSLLSMSDLLYLCQANSSKVNKPADNS